MGNYNTKRQKREEKRREEKMKIRKIRVNMSREGRKNWFWFGVISDRNSDDSSNHIDEV